MTTRSNPISIFDLGDKRNPRETILVKVNASPVQLMKPRHVDLLHRGDGDAVFPAISWQSPGFGGRWEEVDDVRSCLVDFLGLEQSTDEQVFEFVKRYGLIREGVSERGLALVGNTLLAFEHRPLPPDETDTAKWRDGTLKAIENPDWLLRFLESRENRKQKVAEDLTENDWKVIEEAAYNKMQLTYLPPHADYTFLLQSPNQYRWLSVQANAMLRIAAALHGNLRGGNLEIDEQCALVTDWQAALCPQDPASVQPGMGNDFIWEPDLTKQRRCFANLVTQTWLSRANFSTKMDWGEKEGPAPAIGLQPQQNVVTLNHYGLLSLLAFQLLLVFTSPRGMAVCSQCGRVYNPKARRPCAARNPCCGSILCQAARNSQSTSRSRARAKAEKSNSSCAI